MMTLSFHPPTVLALASSVIILLASAREASPQQADDQTLIVSRDGSALRRHLQAALNAVGEHDLFWIVSDTVAPAAGFDPDTQWLESYAKGGFSFEQSVGDGSKFYGELTAVSSYTLGRDAFDARNTGRTRLEEGYMGIAASGVDDLALGLSGGPRALVLGSGMLIADGGASGFDSPLQFGQATRVETDGGTANIVTGVTSAHLCDDVFVKFDRVINRDTFVTAGVSASFPGKGIEDVIDADVPVWLGDFANAVFNF